MPIGAAISAVGAIGSSVVQSNAASKASNQQAAAQQQALEQQQKLYDQGLSTATNALNPFVTSGQSVLPTLQGLLTPGASQTDILKQLPGFQFQSQYGTQATTNALAARGLGGSTGPLARGISDYNQGLASTSFGNLVNALQNYGNMGASAAGTLGTAALGGAIQSGNAQANTLGNIGNAQAAGTLGSANALATGATGTANSVTNALLLSKMLPSASNPAYGGNGVYGGSSSNPLPGLDASDYGFGF
jgi:hypothetical protein